MRGALLLTCGLALAPATARAADTCITLPAPPASAAHAMTRTLFLNYDGVSLSEGEEDDATTNTTRYAEFAAAYAPYGAGSKRDASLQAVLADWSAYDVTLTDTRPAEGAYTMAVVSPTNMFGDGVLGAAPLDCDDAVASNVVLAFHGADDPFEVVAQATTISQELAHAYGLEHVSEPADIMNPAVAGVDASFRDECLILAPGGSPLRCDAQHRRFCNSGQNAHQELLRMFGPASPDTTPPAVTIVSPAHGEAIETSTVTIVAEASDDLGLSDVTLRVDGAPQGDADAVAPYQWIELPLAPGDHCITVEVRDHSDNSAEAGTCFVVLPGEDPAPTTSTGAASLSDGPDADASSAAEHDRGDDGCGCSSSAASSVWLAPLLLAARRRRPRPGP
ncbi:MAG: hypothetical protein JNL82_34695 [Myxococcales bacterium]|nr:hypothetical protein [Myxococcales bacterium]